MNVEEIVEELVQHGIVVGKKCDVCGKEIDGDYWSLTIGNHDWGNDSCERVEDKDLCSEECVTKEFSEYLERCKKGNTEYFEIEQDTFYDIRPKETKNE